MIDLLKQAIAEVEERKLKEGNGVLCLSRKVGEAVVLRMPDKRTITVKVYEIRGWNKVRLAFDAPDDVTIHRDSVQQRIDSGEVRA